MGLTIYYLFYSHDGCGRFFDKYKNADDMQVREGAKAWSTAIGLQAVDGLTVSNYLIELACKILKVN